MNRIDSPSVEHSCAGKVTLSKTLIDGIKTVVGEKSEFDFGDRLKVVSVYGFCGLLEFRQAVLNRYFLR